MTDKPMSTAEAAPKSALHRVEANYVAANANSKAHYQAAQAHLPGGNTRTVLFYHPFLVLM